MMKSSLFSDIKCNASFGRKISSRQAMRSSNLCNSNDDLPQDGFVSRKKQRKQDRGEEQMERSRSVIKSQERFTSDVLEKTYKLFEAELIEKELQNTHHLELRIIRDNLTLLDRRHDRLLERFYRTPNGPMQENIKENLDQDEREIAKLEMNLKKLQEAEVIRRKQVLIARQQAMAADDSFVAGTTRSVQIEPPREIQCSESIRTTSPATTFFSVPLPGVDLPPARDASSFTCIECRKNPSTHKCRKCKNFVCDICCSAKRDLEMIWWCEECFENESLSNQKQIRDGNYESDGEE